MTHMQDSFLCEKKIYNTLGELNNFLYGMSFEFRS